MTPIDSGVWQGRVDTAEGPLARRWHEVMRPLDAATEPGTVVLLGFACDAGVARNHGRVGAIEGPRAIRRALGNMPVHDCERLADAGDVICAGDALEAAQVELGTAVAAELAAGRFPLSLGGGHEIAYASFSGLAQFLAAREDRPRIGIVNFDAHFDLREAEHPNSGTPFLQMARQCEERGWPFRYACIGVSQFANTRALFECAQLLGVRYWLDDVVDGARGDLVQVALQAFLSDVDHVYLTFCLDVLPASVAPGVSGPAPRGVPLGRVEPLIDAVVESRKLRLADIAELNPRFDVDQRTARVAARVVARIANGVARAALG